MEYILPIILQIVLISLNAIFACAEIAVISSSSAKLEKLRDEGNKKAKRLLKISSNPSKFLSTIQVAITLASLLGSAFAADSFGELLSDAVVGWFAIENATVITTVESVCVLAITLVLSFFSIVFGELVPKRVAMKNPEKTALGISGLLSFVSVCFTPFVWVLTKTTNLILRLFKINPNKTLQLFALPAFTCYIVLFPISKFASLLSNGILRIVGVRVNKEASDIAFTKVDLDYFIQSSIDSKNEEDIETEVKIFQNALDFSTIKIRDCIVPRTEIIAVDIDASLDELKSRFIESGISKIIVYKESIDNIIGYIHSSEMFRHAQNWKDHISQIPFVPETMAAQKLMQLFMQQKKTLAVVVDEFGGTSGIVALEDLVEEILGEIEDEHDTSNHIAKKLNDEEYVFTARLEIEKINEMFDLELPESDDYLTLGGLILHHYQSFPKLHEVVKIDRFQFKIIKMSATKIELVRLKVGE
jgi:CBS domain containing-hemolysin-like protein